MNLADLENVQWLEPWRPTPAGLEVELEKEVNPRHQLFGRKAISVGRRDDCDDVLFLLPDHAALLAVVHLTWAGKREMNPAFPHTTFYASLADWVERGMKQDHIEFAIGAE
jgi:hypothetical protein